MTKHKPDTIAADFARLDARLNGWPSTFIGVLLVMLAWRQPHYALSVTVAALAGILAGEAVLYAIRLVRSRIRRRRPAKRYLLIAVDARDAAEWTAEQLRRIMRLKRTRHVLLKDGMIACRVTTDRVLYTRRAYVHPDFARTLGLVVPVVRKGRS